MNKKFIVKQYKAFDSSDEDEINAFLLLHGTGIIYSNFMNAGYKVYSRTESKGVFKRNSDTWGNTTANDKIIFIYKKTILIQDTITLKNYKKFVDEIIDLNKDSFIEYLRNEDWLELSDFKSKSTRIEFIENKIIPLIETKLKTWLLIDSNDKKRVVE